MSDREGLIAELAELDGDEERRRWLAARPELLEGGFVEELCDRVYALLRVDLDRAGRLARSAQLLAEEIDDDTYRGRSYRNLAHVSMFRRDYRAAVRDYRAALETFERIGDGREAAITRYSALTSLSHLGRFDQAFEWADAARETFRRLGDRLRLARLELNLGTLWTRRDRFGKALEHYQAARADLLEVGTPQDVGAVLRNIAVTLQCANDFAASLEAYRRARDYCRQHDLPLLVVELDYNIAYLHYLRGEYARAIRGFEVSREDCRRLEDFHHLALCDLDQSEIYLELNLVAEAGRLAERGGQGFERLGMRYEAAKCLTNLAIARSRQGDLAEALARLDEARRIFVEEQNRVWPAMIDLYRSQLLAAEGQPGAATRLAAAALAAFERSALPSRAALCEIHLARFDLEEGAVERAREHSGSARERLRGLGLPALEYQAWAVTGRAEEACGDRSAALAAYRRADAALERLRGHLQTDELKISFLEDKQEVYESLVWLGLQAREPDRRAVFTDVEKAKSRSLADLLAFRAAEMPAKAGGENDLVDRLRSLRRSLNSYYRQIDLRLAEGAQEQAAELQRRCLAREEELLRALRQLQAADRELSSLQQGIAVDFDEIRSAIPEDAVLLEYYFARGTVYACVIGRDRLEIVAVSSVERVRELHRALQYQLSKLLLGRGYADRFKDQLLRDVGNHLGGLHDELVAPLETLLEGRRQLVIVPHDVLHYVPFHALVGSEGPLIDRFCVSYAPSASVFSLCRAKGTSAGRGALVLGVADERAPLIRREAEAVAEILPEATLFLGEEASEENLRHHGTGARVVHLATHGYFRRDNPMFSAIQLGTSRLSLFDLYDLELDADLVVLSGCGTGLVEVTAADELVGLARGLLYAGARSVLVTLWDVNDESTMELVGSFYRHLTAGSAPATALRRAMCELREAHPHPYYWAPFVLVGEPDSPG